MPLTAVILGKDGVSSEVQKWSIQRSLVSSVDNEICAFLHDS